MIVRLKHKNQEVAVFWHLLHLARYQLIFWCTKGLVWTLKRKKKERKKTTTGRRERETEREGECVGMCVCERERGRETCVFHLIHLNATINKLRWSGLLRLWSNRNKQGIQKLGNILNIDSCFVLFSLNFFVWEHNSSFTLYCHIYHLCYSTVTCKVTLLNLFSISTNSKFWKKSTMCTVLL